MTVTRTVFITVKIGSDCDRHHSTVSDSCRVSGFHGQSTYASVPRVETTIFLPLQLAATLGLHSHPPTSPLCFERLAEKRTETASGPVVIRQCRPPKQVAPNDRGRASGRLMPLSPRTAPTPTRGTSSPTCSFTLVKMTLKTKLRGGRISSKVADRP
jgi:hypothetical protein